jgi:hypothetical protein
MHFIDSVDADILVTPLAKVTGLHEQNGIHGALTFSHLGHIHGLLILLTRLVM